MRLQNPANIWPSQPPKLLAQGPRGVFPIYWPKSAKNHFHPFFTPMFHNRPQRPLHFHSHLSIFAPCSSPSALSLPALPFLTLALFPLSNFLFFPKTSFFCYPARGRGQAATSSCTLQGAPNRRASLYTPSRPCYNHQL
jgi:hypothetical protein